MLHALGPPASSSGNHFLLFFLPWGCFFRSSITVALTVSPLPLATRLVPTWNASLSSNPCLTAHCRFFSLRSRAGTGVIPCAATCLSVVAINGCLDRCWFLLLGWRGACTVGIRPCLSILGLLIFYFRMPLQPSLFQLRVITAAVADCRASTWCRTWSNSCVRIRLMHNGRATTYASRLAVLTRGRRRGIGRPRLCSALLIECLIAVLTGCGLLLRGRL